MKGHLPIPGPGRRRSVAIHAALIKTAAPGGRVQSHSGCGPWQSVKRWSRPADQGCRFYRLKAVAALCSIFAHSAGTDSFFGEFGSVNPMFLLPEAMKTCAVAGRRLAASLTMGAGQFLHQSKCRVVIDGSDADSFVQSTCALKRSRRRSC